MASLALDDGGELTVLATERDRFRQALRALRQAKPGIAIDGDTDAVVWVRELGVGMQYSFASYYIFHPDLGLLGKGGARWLSPQEREFIDARMAK